MKALPDVGLREVQTVYGGAERELWELIMGQQIHIGGLPSSLELAQRAQIQPGTNGVDLCCCTGAGMRFLIRFRKVARMTGVDATQAVLDLGCTRSDAEGLGDRIRFALRDATATNLPSGSFDFVWGEDAWCYVVDKPGLIAEAVRLVKPGGVIAFTDWVEGPAGVSDSEAERFLRFMKFPNIEDLGGYRNLLEDNGCEVQMAEDTGRFAPCIDLYLQMLTQQLSYDMLRILNFDVAFADALGGEMAFTQQLAHAGKIIQGRFVAVKK